MQADKAVQFNVGAAIIQKGNQFALIDYKGNIVVPFGLYSEIIPIPNSRILSDERDPFAPDESGLFEVKNNMLENGGFINFKGEVVYKPQSNADYTNVKKSRDNQVVGITERVFNAKGIIEFKDVFFDSKGHKVSLISPSNIVWNEGIGCYQDFNTKLYGYIDLNGKVLIRPQYTYAYPFSDGVAAALTESKYQINYKFFNYKNDIFFECDMLSRPVPFRNGFTSITKGFNSTRYLVNKNGEVAFPNDSVITNKFVFNERIDQTKDYIFGKLIDGDLSECAIDKYGKIYSLEDLQNSLGATQNIEWYGLLPGYKGQFYCTDSTRKKFGIFDFDRHLYIPPVFARIYIFDSVSKLAYAKLVLSQGEDEWDTIYREGYINTDGLFVIILKN